MQTGKCSLFSLLKISRFYVFFILEVEALFRCLTQKRWNFTFSISYNRYKSTSKSAPSSWKVFINFETKIRGLIRLWCREIRSFEKLVKKPIIRWWTPWSIIWKSSLIMTIIRCPFITWHFLNTLCQIRLLIATELLCNYLLHSIIVYILLYEGKGVVCSKSSKSNDIWFWRKIH